MQESFISLCPQNRCAVRGINASWDDFYLFYLTLLQSRKAFKILIKILIFNYRFQRKVSLLLNAFTNKHHHSVFNDENVCSQRRYIQDFRICNFKDVYLLQTPGYEVTHRHNWVRHPVVSCRAHHRRRIDQLAFSGTALHLGWTSEDSPEADCAQYLSEAQGQQLERCEAMTFICIGVRLRLCLLSALCDSR